MSVSMERVYQDSAVVLEFGSENWIHFKEQISNDVNDSTD